MFKKFTTASEMLEFMEFPKWKKTHEKFNYNLFLSRIGYYGKAKLINITFYSFMALMITGTVSACFSATKGLSLSTTWVPLFILSLIGIRFVIPHVMNLIDWFSWRAYSRKFKAFMNEARLVEFVDLISQDIHATYKLKNKNSYKDLILACHHQDKEFVTMAYNIMNEFYIHKEVQLKKSYNDSVVTNFLNKEVQKNSQITMKPSEEPEDKFQFMG